MGNSPPFMRMPDGSWQRWSVRESSQSRCRSNAMRLTPTEIDRLTIFTAAELARRRRAKGWKLTHPEALALICDEMHEAARGGASYEEVVAVASRVLTE